MNIQRVDNYDGTRSKYLDISKLVPFTKDSSLALITEVRLGKDRYESGFITFSIKDCNGNLLSGRLFNVEDYLVNGGKAALFKGRAVSISYLVQEFNGRYSLVIHDIELWDGDFDKERFLGEISVDCSAIESIGKAIFGTWDIPVSYKIASFSSIAGWRIGGFIKLFDMALASLSGFNMVEGINYAELMRVFFKSMEAYYRFLKDKSVYGELSTIKVFDLLLEYQRSMEQEKVGVQILDTIRGLFGIAKPEHIYAHIICKVVNMSLQLLNASYEVLAVPIGSVVKSGEMEVLRY